MRVLPLESLLLLVLALPAAAQEDPRLAGTGRYRAFLERRPYHVEVFEDLYEAAVAAGALEPLVALYEERLAGDAADSAARVVLVRLAARAGRLERAEELARPLGETALEPLLLLARLRVHAGQPARAAALYEQAFDAAEGLAEQRDVLRQLAAAKLLTDDLSGARSAFLRLAQLDPLSFPARVEAADFLAHAGLHDDAARQYAEAVALASDDAARRCHALAALGTEREALHDGAAALEAYDEALALLGRSHWLRRDLLARVLALHETAGTLDTWIERCASSASAEGGRPEDFERWAQALQRARRADDAARVLADAAARFPRDAALSDALLANAEARGDPDARVAELERRRLAAPADRELLLRLGDAHVAARDVDRAERAWSAAVELAGEDVETLCAVAARWLRAREVGRARACLERAAARDPRDVAAARELYEVLCVHSDPVDAATQLEVLAGLAAGSAQGLTDVAELFVERGDRARACALLAEACRLRPDAAPAHARRAELLVLEGDTAGAREALRTLIAVAGDAPQRTAALRRLEQLLATPAARAAWIERERAARGPDDPTAYLVLAHLHERHDPDRAIVRYRDFLGVIGGGDKEARLALIEQLSRARRYPEALQELAALAASDPRERSGALLRKATLLESLGRDDEALAALAVVRRDAKNSPDLLERLAQRYEALERDDLALEALEHALRLDPGDARIARALGHFYGRADHRSKARQRLLLAWRNATGDEQREEIAAEIWSLFAHDADRERELESLQRRCAENPFDSEAPQLLLEFRLLGRDHVQAGALAELMLRRRPDDARYVRARARARFLAGDLDGTAADVRRLAALGHTPDDLIVAMVSALIEERGERGTAEALELGRLASDPARVGRALMVAGHYRRAADFLRGYAEQHGLANEELVALLTELRRYLDDFPDFAIQVFEAAELRLGPSVDRAQRLGYLYHEIGDDARALDYGRRLVELGADDEALEGYFFGIERFDELSTMRAREAYLQRSNAEAVRAALARFLVNRYDAPAALQLLEDLALDADHDGGRPLGIGPREWRLELAGWQRSLLLRNPTQRDARRAALLERALADEPLGASAWAQLLWLVEPDARAVHRDRRREAQRLLSPGAQQELLAQHPDSPELLGVLADWAVRDGRRRAAIGLYRRLLERFDDDPELAAWDAARSARTAAQHRARVEAALPADLRARVEDQLELVASLHRVARGAGPRRIEALPSRAEVALHLVQCLARTGQDDAARVVLERLAPAETDVEGLVTYAALCSTARLQPELSRALGALYELAHERFEGHPRIRDAGTWRGDLRADLEQMGRWCVARRLLGLDS